MAIQNKVLFNLTWLEIINGMMIGDLIWSHIMWSPPSRPHIHHHHHHHRGCFKDLINLAIVSDQIRKTWHSRWSGQLPEVIQRGSILDCTSHNMLSTSSWATSSATSSPVPSSWSSTPLTSSSWSWSTSALQRGNIPGGAPAPPYRIIRHTPNLGTSYHSPIKILQFV